MTARLVIVQSAASGIDLACGVLLLHAVSMHVTALLPHDAVLHVFHAVSRLWLIACSRLIRDHTNRLP